MTDELDRARMNDERWSQAHGHARRGLGELPDHAGTTPDHTLADIARLADRLERVRMFNDPDLVTDVAQRIVDMVDIEDWNSGPRERVIVIVGDMIELAIPSAYAYSRAVASAAASTKVCKGRSVERDDALSELARARRDIRLGAAVRGLVEQVERLRKRPPMAIDISREGVAKHVASEVREVLNEIPGSQDAHRECAGVIATSLHMAVVDRAPIVRIIECETDRLERRLDVVEAGGTWEGAKAEEITNVASRVKPTEAGWWWIWGLIRLL